MKLGELYQQKGEAVTQIEVWQARLQNINKQIIDTLNKSENKVSENSKEKSK